MAKMHLRMIVMTATNDKTLLDGLLGALEIVFLREYFPRSVVLQLRGESVFEIQRIRIFRTQICLTDVVPFDSQLVNKKAAHAHTPFIQFQSKT